MPLIFSMLLLFVCYICNECPKFPLAYNCLAADSDKKKLEQDLNHTQNWTQLFQDETFGSSALNSHLAEDLGQISRSL